MSFKLFSLSIAALSLALLSGCSGHNHVGHHDHEGDEGHEYLVHQDHDGHDDHDESHESAGQNAKPDSDHIVLSHEAEENAGIKTEVVSPSPFREVTRAGGGIENTRTAERTISAPAAGIVSFTGNMVTGSSVSQGLTICTVSSRGMEASDNVAAAKANLAAARKQLEHGEKLFKANLMTKREYESLKNDVAVAEATLSGMSSRSATSGVAVSSPIAGYLVKVNVRSGEYVNAGDPIAVVSQTRRLMLRADVSERHIASLHDVVSANIVTADRRTVKLDALNPRVISSGSPDAAAGAYVPVYIEFDNPGGLYSGVNVQAFLLGKERGEVISVPKAALVEDSGVLSVYVQTGHCEYQRREVTLGANDGSRVEVKSGLKAGDKVVTNGAMSIRMAGMGSAIQGHTHNH